VSLLCIKSVSDWRPRQYSVVFLPSDLDGESTLFLFAYVRSLATVTVTCLRSGHSGSSFLRSPVLLPVPPLNCFFSSRLAPVLANESSLLVIAHKKKQSYQRLKRLPSLEILDILVFVKCSGSFNQHQEQQRTDDSQGWRSGIHCRTECL